MISAATEDNITDRSQVLSLQAVKGYADKLKERGHIEYNNGTIHVRGKHPLDECLRRGIIEEEHHEIGKRLRNYRDCALSKLSGRTYNAHGDGDSEMDAATIYARLMRSMVSTPGKKRSWELVVLVCFADSDIGGKYFCEADYSMLYGLAPNIKHALETTDEVIQEVRVALKKRLEKQER